MFKFSEEPKLSPVSWNWKVLLPPSTDTIVNPAPSAAASLAAPSAI